MFGVIHMFVSMENMNCTSGKHDIHIVIIGFFNHFIKAKCIYKNGYEVKVPLFFLEEE